MDSEKDASKKDEKVKSRYSFDLVHDLSWEDIYPDSNPGRGSLKVVVRELWSTKYLTPSAVYFISQPGGRGCSLIILQQGEGSEHGPSRSSPVLGIKLTHLPAHLWLWSLKAKKTSQLWCLTSFRLLRTTKEKKKKLFRLSLQQEKPLKNQL